MTQVALKLALPDALAHEAEEAGLLSSDSLERLLREEIQRRRVDRFFDAADRLASLNMPPLTESEIEAEIETTRAQRRASDASHR